MSLSKMILTNSGPLEPLCNSCETQDCSHPIEPKSVSIMGVNKEWKILAYGDDSYMVLECEGYSRDLIQ